jgi:uncharacterized glyoxalase superfamily protein PhnB
MAVSPIPKGFHTVTPYLVVKGVAELLVFVEKAFAAKVIEKHARPDGVVMHATVQIGDSIVMLGDATGGPPGTAPIPAALYIYVPNVDEVYKRALAAGGKSKQEVTDMFYGDRHGGVVDAWGNQWWIATHVEDVAPDEMERRAQKHMQAQHAK